MSLLPVLILGSAALLLHLALTVAAAPVVERLIDDLSRYRPGRRPVWAAAGPAAAARARLTARLADQAAAWAARPWREWRRLMAKEPVLAGNASPVSSLAPLLALAVTLCAACLVPSFCVGMLTGPVSDLPVILALLGLARLAMIVSGLDIGSAAPGLAGMALAVDLLLALPGLALAIAALWLVFGSSSLEAILATPPAGPGPTMPALVAGAGLALGMLAAAGSPDALSDELSGPDLALFRLQSALQRLVGIELVTALLLPGSLALAQSNPLHWLLGLLLWTIRIAAACVVLAALRSRLAAPGVRRSLATVSVLLGLLAPLLLAGHGVP